MLYFKTDIYDEFRCVMCGTCCRNDWLVTVDAGGYERNKALFAAAGKAAEFEKVFILLKDGGPGEYAAIAKQPDGGCWFLGSDNHCRLHREAGHGHLDPVCQLFPRYPVNTTRGVELTLSFSCPEVVRLVSRRAPLAVIRSEEPGAYIPPDSFVAGVYPEQQPVDTPLRHYFELEHHFSDILQQRCLPLAERLDLLRATALALEGLKRDEEFRTELGRIIAANYRLLDAKAGAENAAPAEAEILLEHFFVNLVFKKIFYLHGLAEGVRLLSAVWGAIAAAREQAAEPAADLERTRAAVMAAEFEYSHHRRSLLGEREK
ncbi:MAG: flagellin lysine-N-methylase [Negativicutes bacterium]|nr:flagellin lysine-N-methylase [Negativicutes bacterium]